MLIDRQGNTTIITQEKLNLKELAEAISNKYDEMSNDNLVINLSSFRKIMVDEILEFLRLSNTHRGSQHSFVIVTEAINYDEAPDELIIVPTMQEAFDIIEMEEIERDLGF